MNSRVTKGEKNRNIKPGGAEVRWGGWQGNKSWENTQLNRHRFKSFLLLNNDCMSGKWNSIPQWAYLSTGHNFTAALFSQSYKQN